MNFNLAENILILAQNQAQDKAQAAKEKLAEHIANMSPWERIAFIMNNTGVSATHLILGLIIVLSCLIVGVIYYRRFSQTKMGYVFVTILIIGVRAQNPTDLVWSIAALVVAIITFVLTLYMTTHVDFSRRKEPIYFLLNGFSLILVAFPIGGEVPFYSMAVALVSSASSMYFLMQKKFTPKKAAKKNNADEAIINVLDKRRDKNYGKPPWENNK